MDVNSPDERRNREELKRMHHFIIGLYEELYFGIAMNTAVECKIVRTSQSRITCASLKRE